MFSAHFFEMRGVFEVARSERRRVIEVPIQSRSREVAVQVSLMPDTVDTVL